MQVFIACSLHVYSPGLALFPQISLPFSNQPKIGAGGLLPRSNNHVNEISSRLPLIFLIESNSYISHDTVSRLGQSDLVQRYDHCTAPSTIHFLTSADCFLQHTKATPLSQGSFAGIPSLDFILGGCASEAGKCLLLSSVPSPLSTLYFETFSPQLAHADPHLCVYSVVQAALELSLPSVAQAGIESMKLLLQPPETIDTCRPKCLVCFV